MPTLDKDTQVCISLSGRPSNIGTRFHNFLYDELGLNFAYKAFTTDDIAGAIAGVRALGIRGCSVSMPFKQSVLELVDSVEPSAKRIGAANTIVNDGGVLTASNTDVEAVEQLLLDRHADVTRPVVIRGSGGMASAVAEAFSRCGIRNMTVWARNESAGQALATRYEGRWVAAEPSAEGAVIVNVTPVGMAGADEDGQSFSDAAIAAAHLVFDVVAFPAETPLIRAARAEGKPVITGAEVIALQAARQFARYTGVTPTAEQVARAAAHSRA